MSAMAQHMRTRLVNGMTIATTPTERRTAMGTIFRLAAGSTLLAVCLVDTHLHLLARCTREAASKLLHAIEVGLRRRLALPVAFAMYPHEPVLDARHLRNAFRYVLNQHEHHGLQNDPLREGTNLHDLLGLRLAGDYTHANVRRWLPRVSRRQLCGWLGVASLTPSDEPLSWVHDAALSAACLPSLAGRTRQARQTRRAVVEVVDGRWSTAELADTLQITRRSIERLRHLPVDDQLVQAIRLQLDLRTQINSRQESEPAMSPGAWDS